MAAPTPAISVIIAVRNAAPYLDATLASLAAQDFADFEIVLVENGSRDESPRIAAEWARHDDRLRVVRLARPGLARSLAFAVDEARAPLIARLDGDDVALPERLAVQHAFMRTHPSVGLAGSWVETIDGAGQLIGERRLPTEDGALRRFLKTGNPFVHSSVIMRRDAYLTAGGYRIGLPISEDFDLWSRMADVTELANIDRVLVRYRVHGSGHSSRHPVRLTIADTCIIAAQEARRRGVGEPFDNGRPVLRRALDLAGGSRADFRYRALKHTVAVVRLARLYGHRDHELRLRRQALRLIAGMRPRQLPRGLARLVSSYFRPHTRLRRRLVTTPPDHAGVAVERARP